MAKPMLYGANIHFLKKKKTKFEKEKKFKKFEKNEKPHLFAF